MIHSPCSVGMALFQGQYFINNAILLAAANMATIPLLIAFLFFQKQLVEGVALSGLKESLRRRREPGTDVPRYEKQSPAGTEHGGRNARYIRNSSRGGSCALLTMCASTVLEPCACRS
jgi:hypothetical protein